MKKFDLKKHLTENKLTTNSQIIGGIAPMAVVGNVTEKKEEEPVEEVQNSTVNEYQGSGEDIIEIIRDKAEDSGFSEEEETGEVIEFLQGLSFDDNGNIDHDGMMQEGASTEEKRIAALAAKKIARLRSVSHAEALVDLVRAANELRGNFGEGSVNEAADGKAAYEEIRALIQKHARALNDDEAYTMHELLKDFFNRYI